MDRLLGGEVSPDLRRVVVVQPRRIAAISLARYVSACIGEPPGQLVGHEVRFSQGHTRHTRILYVTEGILLNWLHSMDSNLLSIGILILDEIHERSLSLDIICGMLVVYPSLLATRKLILMSATACYGSFSQFLCDYSIGHLQIPGRLFPVQLLYITSLDKHLLASDQIGVLARLVRHLHQTEPLDAGILVFLPGQAEISHAMRLIQREVKLSGLCMGQSDIQRNDESLALFQMHSLIPLPEQERCLHFMTSNTDPTFRKRKVVLATNIAETSLTIPGIRIVIDIGLSRIARHDPVLHVTSLETVQCSREQADQRKGRAGREGPGQCYRLYTEYCYQHMKSSVEPEICRVRCEPLILWLTSNNISLRTFPFISVPPLANLASAYDALYTLGIVNSKGELTDVGVLLQAFPVLFQHGRMLAEVVQHVKHGRKDMASVYRELIVIIACVETFMNAGVAIQWPHDTITAARALQSDHLALLLLYRSYLEAEYKADWCYQYNVPHYLMLHCEEIVKQLTQSLHAVCPELTEVPNLVDKASVASILKVYLSIGYKIQQASLTLNGSYVLSHYCQLYNTKTSSNRLIISSASLLKLLFPKNVLFTAAIKATEVTLHFITQIGD